MDYDSQVFSHQRKLALQLKNYFSRVTVITMSPSRVSNLDSSIEVYSVGWSRNEKYFSVLRLIFVFLFTTRKRSDIIFFSHMTDFASALLGPICKFRRIPHVLWYAHTSKSKWLRVAIPFVDIVATSTSGSCPYVGPKLRAIGQSIDTQDFRLPEILRSLEFNNFIHVGRIDASKQIEIVIDTFISILTTRKEAILTLIGEPTKANYEYYLDLLSKYKPWIESGNIRFSGKRNRLEIVDALGRADIFLHAFQGSLDKSILEATAMAVPVVTLNREYRAIFYTDNHDCDTTEDSREFLKCLVARYISMTEIELNNMRKRRANIVREKHSTDNWIRNLLEVLEEL